MGSVYIDKLKDNLQTQLAELESLQSMFYNPGELRIEDPSALAAIESFVAGKTDNVPPFLDVTVNILVDERKFELCVNLSHEYPDIEPDLYVRNQKLKKQQHAEINRNVGEFVGSLERGEPCIFNAISWLQDNASNYLAVEEVPDLDKTKTKDRSLSRLWIYSHHIYSKTKRREIVNLANTLCLTGFCMPGKPGVICIEGTTSDCNEWWQAIKSMNWKRIFCKINEKGELDVDQKEFRKFRTFEEVVFQNNSIKCNHMDMGELSKFLDDHKCGYVFKELFGVEARNSS